MDRICITQAQSTREIKASQYKGLLRISETITFIKPKENIEITSFKTSRFETLS